MHGDRLVDTNNRETCKEMNKIEVKECDDGRHEETRCKDERESYSKSDKMNTGWMQVGERQDEALYFRRDSLAKG